LDFGISKRAEQGQRDRKLTGEFDILGTPEYMSPEQALGRTASANASADQYALAVILFEMLTGQVPFTADDVMELLQRVIRDLPVAPSALRAEIPAALDVVILKALSKEPSARFESITDFADSLERAIGDRRSGSAPDFAQEFRSNPRASRPTEDKTFAPEPVTGTRRTSWHSGDPVQAILELVERTRQELGLDNLDLAVNCAESAIEIAQSVKTPEVKEIIARNATLFQRIFERRLGGLSRTLTVSASAGHARGLSPEQAFLLSRLEGGLSIEETLDLSPMTKEATLGHLVGLMRLGHISIRA
jgi:serine/threonine protein kinase